MAATRPAAEALRLQKKFSGDEIKTIKALEARLRGRRSAIASLAKDVEADVKRVEAIRKSFEGAMKSLEANDRL